MYKIRVRFGNVFEARKPRLIVKSESSELNSLLNPVLSLVDLSPNKYREIK